MKEYRVDLHIHSVLSPCAHLLMTPGEIIRRARSLGLDMIAITDHNTTGNLEVALDLAAKYDLEIIPGMELETREEVHLLCLFPELEQARKWQEEVDASLPARNNREDIFGSQLLTNREDRFTGRESRLLSTATLLSLEEAVEGVISLGGAVVPSHIERTNGLINNLGLIPPGVGEKISWLEINNPRQRSELCEKYPFLRGYSLISGSDAHHPEQMGEGAKIRLSGAGPDALIERLR